MPARPLAQRVPRQVPGEWAIRNIGQKPKESNCTNWRTQTDWPEIQKHLEAPQTACPFGRWLIPPCYIRLRGAGTPGAPADVPLCPPVSSSPRVIGHPDPGSLLTSHAHGCGCPSHLFPEPSPQQSSAGPPLRSLPAPSLKTPRAEHPVILPLSPPIDAQRPCSPQFSPFNMLSLAKPTAWVLSLTLKACNPNKVFKCILFWFSVLSLGRGVGGDPKMWTPLCPSQLTVK